MATTPYYGMTLLEQAQAQKEVTVNQALMRIDKLLKSSENSGSLTDWRINPTTITDNGGEASAILAAMTAGNDAPELVINPAATRTLVFDIAAMATDGMVTFELDSDTDITYTITYEESFDGGSSYSTPVNVSLIAPNADSCYRRQKFSVGAGSARKVRLSFAHNRTASGTDVGYRTIRGLRFVQFDADNLHDYVVLIGASIMQANARARDWEGWWRRYFSRDAVIFNESVNGWAAGNFASGIGAIIARHPHARYFLIHIGGNDVTLLRPFATATQAELDDLRVDMTNGLNVIVAAGATPVLSRISYRNYTASPAVSGTANEENGSKPFNEAVQDKLIADYCPQASNGQRGIVDPYGYLSSNVFLIDLTLDSLGIHPEGYGGYRLSRYWALAFGSVLFQRREWFQINESATLGVPGAKEDIIISFGNTPANLWDPLRVGHVDSPEGMTYNQCNHAVQTKSPLVNTEGERCPLGMTITTAFGGVGGSGYTGATNTGFVRRAKTGYVFAASGSPATFEITGLNNSATYRLEFLPSRDGATVRTATYTIGGVSKSQDAANNDTATVVFTGIVPASNKIVVQASSDTFNYLNVMRVSRE